MRFSRAELLRWACVLPAAALAAMVVASASSIVSMVLTSMLRNLEVPTLVYCIKFALFHLPKKAAFVIGGALSAPRHNLITSLVLALLASIMSLFVHILSQRTVGPMNYIHFAAETTGAALGALCIALAYRPTARPTTKPPGEDGASFPGSPLGTH